MHESRSVVLYDERGLILYDQITDQEAYYLFGKELEIFKQHGDEIVGSTSRFFRLLS